jgi:3-methyladenine DNA glycosylase AlkD
MANKNTKAGIKPENVPGTEAIKQKLRSLADEKYGKFSAGLIPGADNMLGVRLPDLRKLGKELSKGDWRAYLADADDEYYEETMLQGIVIGLVKTDIEESLQLVADFIPKISNWGICDSFCAGLGFVKRNKPRIWEFLKTYTDSDREFELRFASVMLMDYFIDGEYIGDVLKLLDGIRHEGYYVKMAVAWALSVCFVKFPEKTMEYLKNNSLDNFTYNKALQKITESNRVDGNTKNLMRSMKRKNI